MNKCGKIVKACVAGGILYGAFEFAYVLGKGSLLGTMLKYDVSAKETLDILSSKQCENSMRAAFIKSMALLKKNGEES